MVNGVDVSQHRTEREALESALNKSVPGADVRYRHEYLVIVQLSASGPNKTAALLGGQIVVNGE
jgi:hypothetical protein